MSLSLPTKNRKFPSDSPPSESDSHRKHESSTSVETVPVAARSSRLVRFIRGADEDPNWARPALFGLLAFTAALYLFNLSNSGYANEFYAAAVKSGTKSWTAWLFGSLDSANAITVDKPPASLWVMGLSARLFGFSSFSLLLPQALMGVGTVALTYGAIRRWHGHAAGLAAGTLIALTPVAALMFRFDNPDAMLVLLMTAAVYAIVRTVDALSPKTALKWMVGAGLLVGFAFLTKMLQGLLVLPTLGLVYLVAARFNLKTRILHLLAGLVSVIVGAGWFIVLADLWPSASRPYIGGSTNNTLWDLAIGYNGLGRIFGGQGNGGGGGGMGGSNSGFGGTPGLLRMFNSAFGAEISWLLPAAIILLVAAAVSRGKAPRTDRVRAGVILWGSWLVVTAACLSMMQGTVHPYYVIALAPAIAGSVALGAREVLTRSSSLIWRCVAAISIIVTAVWSFRLLATTAGNWMPALRWITVILAVIGACLFVAAGAWEGQRARKITTSALIVATLASLGGTSAWTFATAAQGHSGSIPTSGPVAGGGMGGGMGSAPTGGTSATTKQSGTKPSGTVPSGTKPSGSAPSGTASSGSTNTGTAPTPPSGSAQSAGAGAQSANAGGTAQGGQGGSSNAALVKLLNATDSRWSAAVIGDQTAAGYILNSDTAVLSIGGWSGTDNNVTLAQFQAYVKSGDIHYFIAGGGMGGGPGGNTGSSSAITAWVKAHYKATTVGGLTVYDLTQPTS